MMSAPPLEVLKQLSVSICPASSFLACSMHANMRAH
jgi:hypothetical protein